MNGERPELMSLYGYCTLPSILLAQFFTNSFDAIRFSLAPFLVFHSLFRLLF